MEGRSTRIARSSSSQDTGGGAMAALTGFVLKHKRIVLGGWLLVLIAAFAAIGPAGSALSQQFSIPGREGFETNKELAAIYGSGGDVAPIVPVVQLPAGYDRRLARRSRRSSMRRWRRSRSRCRTR